jgi:hypothetical protein
MINAWIGSLGTTHAGVSLYNCMLESVTDDRYEVERCAIQT